jgi:voltage-gated potassium channel Kch
MVHIIACFWYFIAAMEPDDVDTWITAAAIQEKTHGEKYLTSIYWGYTTMLTVGYGDITPNTNTEVIFAIIWMCLGAGIYTQVIGNLASVLATMDTKDSTIQDKISTIEEFCKEAKISSELRYKLRDSIEYATGKNFFSWVDKQ